MSLIKFPKDDKAYRYRVMGYTIFPTDNEFESGYTSCAGAIAQSDTPEQALADVARLMGEFPACVHFTITRGYWK
jgi:hypothetical protein